MSNTRSVEECQIDTSLARLGWNSFFSNKLRLVDSADVNPARVVGVHKNSFLVSNGERTWLTTVAGKILYSKDAVFPVVGDWVLVESDVIKSVLPRQNKLSRGESGGHGAKGVHKTQKAKTAEQAIAANIDTVFIVMGLDQDFNLRRLERYTTLVYNCGMTPVVVLTKADLHKFPEEYVAEVESVAFGVPVYVVAQGEDAGIVALTTYVSTGKTVAMIGSSGVGKSTLLNRLAGEDIQFTAAISDRVQKGRHTTTARELKLLPQGGMIVDNPGIREVGLVGSANGLESTFSEIDELARACRFADCTHTTEPGCAVLKAVSERDLSEERLSSYHKMKRELAYLAEREHKCSDRIEKERWKGVAQLMKSMKKERSNG